VPGVRIGPSRRRSNTPMQNAAAPDQQPLWLRRHMTHQPKRPFVKRVRTWSSVAAVGVSLLFGTIFLWPAAEHLSGAWRWRTAKHLWSSNQVFAAVREPTADELLAAGKLTNALLAMPEPRQIRLVAKRPFAPGQAYSVRNVDLFVSRENVTNFWSEMAEAVRTNEQSFASVRAALRATNICFGYTPEAYLLDRKRPHLDSLSRASIWLQLRGELAVRELRHDEALNAVRDLLALSVALRNEQVWLDQITRARVVRRAIELTWEILHIDDWPAGDLDTLQSLFSGHEFARPMLEALDLEWENGRRTLAKLKEGVTAEREWFVPPDHLEKPSGWLQDWDRVCRVHIVGGAWSGCSRMRHNRPTQKEFIATE
jgi:hypothetical protein